MVTEAFLPSFGVLGSSSATIAHQLKIGFSAMHFTIYLITFIVIIAILFLILVLRLILHSRRQPIVSGKESLIGQKSLLTIDHEGKYWIMLQGEHWQCRSHTTLTAGQQIVVTGIDGLTLLIDKE